MPISAPETASECDPQLEVSAFLEAQAFGTDPVRVIETHTSRVFLTGERAFKLKRAVRYSYLDYSTPERRQAACEAELAVNRCFAPSLYLAVEPIVRESDGHLRLGAASGGTPVDWVVAMRRFPQEDQLDCVAERGALTRPILVALADAIAELHGQAELRPAGGGSAGLARAIDITVENLRLEVDRAFDAASVADWTGRVRVSLHENGPLLERRRRAGSVRACHGDLHLRNVCLIEGTPTPFDAIEFDEDLRSIDLLYDLAFLLMDLHARGLDGAANLVLNRYLDMRAEEDGLAALPLFLSVRAAIRAQVSAAAGRRARDPSEGRHAFDQAARYLRIARALLDRPQVRLVAIGGLSGTGKSTLAYALAPLLGSPPGARVLRSDVLRKRVAGLPPEAKLPAAAYGPKAHEDIYRRLATAAGHCLAGGRATIMDAVFGTEAERSAVEAVAHAAGVRFDGLWLEASFDTMVQRIETRGRDASDASVDVVRAQLATHLIPPASWLRIDAGMPADDVRHRAAGALLDTTRLVR